MCMPSPMFLVAINGNMVGHFRSSKGIRHDDPLSPYLFVLAMERFAMIMRDKARKGEFQPHPKCTGPLVSYLPFDDDLLVLIKGNNHMVGVVKETLTTFKSWAGLEINQSKCALFKSGIDPATEEQMKSTLGNDKGSLPLKYLRLPLMSTRLKYGDCISLIEKVNQRISSWKVRTLSLTGRVELIKAVLQAFFTY